MAQRPAAGGALAGGSFGSPVTVGNAPLTTVPPGTPPAPATGAPESPFNQIEPTSSVVATPRGAGGFTPRGPSTFGTTPQALGQSFQQSLLAADPPRTQVFDPAASVPTAFLPAQTPADPQLIENFPVFIVPGTFPGTFEIIPAFQFAPNGIATLGRSELANTRPLTAPETPVTFNFPPGARIVSQLPADASVSVPREPLTVPGLGASPGVESERGIAPPRVLPGEPAAARQEPIRPVPGTGSQIVRPPQARTD